MAKSITESFDFQSFHEVKVDLFKGQLKLSSDKIKTHGDLRSETEEINHNAAFSVISQNESSFTS